MPWTKIDRILLVQGVITLLLAVTALTNAYKAFGYLALLNLSIWLVLATSTKNVKYGIAVGGATFVVSSICLSLIFYYWELYKGVFPDFTILGMHPGFFVLFPTWWLLLFVLVTLMYPLLFEKAVLSEEDVKKFEEKYKEQNLGGV